jgi:25S rRNA (adenine2142-N1)-methyltransferase
MEWLKPYTQLLKDRGTTEKICLLEVGALSTQNACSKSGLFDIERIDLNSQSEGIKQQDFMERPLPRLSAEKFEIISLSLVLNYVPDPVVRGDMLKRTLQFLQPPIGKDQEELSKIFPALFLVLPAPCVENSRYLDEARLEAIMNSIGYVKEQHKVAKKVVYYLWRATTTQLKKGRELFKKIEVRSGATRNNFAVVMK